MRVFKFGGASVKSSAAVKNVGRVLKEHTDGPTLVVISAMGKTTNMMESLASAYYHRKPECKKIFKEIKSFHEEIIADLIEDQHDYYEVDNLFIELECLIETNQEEQMDYDKLYDRIVPFGELISTKIVSTYLSRSGYPCRWIDARNFVITTDRHRAAKVKWDVSTPLISNNLNPILHKQTVITQGFIGRNENHENTTLGREGSDYSAAIFAYALDAESVTIWKDVEGVMNADPKRFDHAKLIEELSYNEAIELAYFGASVIHPKTIQPLKSKGIPLYVKSFVNTGAAGTKVMEHPSGTLNNIQCYIVKDDQCLIKISSKDYSFIVEDNMLDIFQAFSSVGIQMNLMQNSAISFVACINNDSSKIEKLNALLTEKFNTEVIDDLKLFTVFNYDENNSEVDDLTSKYTQVLEQRSNSSLQLILQA